MNSRAGIFWGTGCFIVATLVSLVASRILFGRIPVMPLVSAFVVVVFGGLTLWLQDELFIKLKPTIVNSIFASVLFGGLFFGKSLLSYLFGDVFSLTEEGWRKLTFRWACFFVFLAVLNEFAWRLLTTGSMGELQGFCDHADHHGLRHLAGRPPAAPRAQPPVRRVERARPPSISDEQKRARRYRCTPLQS